MKRQVLTPRETEIANLVSAGYSTQEIADLLYLSTNTVKTHLTSIYRKLGVHTRVQLAQSLRRDDGRLGNGVEATADVKGRRSLKMALLAAPLAAVTIAAAITVLLSTPDRDRVDCSQVTVESDGVAVSTFEQGGWVNRAVPPNGSGAVMAECASP
jgi:DNA-binding CsgD family transcriptional regulator